MVLPLRSKKAPSWTVLFLLCGIIVFCYGLYFPSSSSCASVVASVSSCKCPPPASACPFCTDALLACPSCVSPSKSSVQFPNLPPREQSALEHEFSAYTPPQWESRALDLMRSNIKDKFTLITVAADREIDLVLNWVATLQVLEYSKFLVFCLDMNLFMRLLKLGLKNHVVLSPPSWRANSRVDVVRHLVVQYDFSIVFAETTALFQSKFVVKHVGFLIGYGCDANTPSQCFAVGIFVFAVRASHPNLKNKDAAYMYGPETSVNTAFFAARPTPEMKSFFATLERMEDFNLHMKPLQYSKNFKGLDRVLYANQDVYFSQKINTQWRIQPLVIHINEPNVRVLKHYGLWKI